MVGDGDIDGLGVGARDGYGDAVGCGDIVGIAVEEPPPHTQHISLAVKSSSLYESHMNG